MSPSSSCLEGSTKPDTATMASKEIRSNQQQQPQQPHRRLTLCRRLAFGLAGPPLQLTQNVIGLYLNLFLLEVAQLRPMLISLVLFSGRFLDAVSDPLIGYGVSRTRTSIGKCRPWLLASALLSALSFLALWLRPGEINGLAYFLPVYMAFSVAISCYHIPYTTLTVRISAVPSERDSATAFRMAFEMLGILVGPTVFAFTVEPKRSSVSCALVAQQMANLTASSANASGINEGNNVTLGTSSRVSATEEKAAYLIAAIVVASLVTLCGLTGFLGIREVDDIPGDREDARQSMREYAVKCKQIVTYRPFVKATATFITLSLSWHIFQAISILYLTHVVQLPWHVPYCTLVYLSVALIATPCWYAFSVRFGKKVALMIGSVGTTLCCLSAGAMPPGMAPLFYALTVAAGVMGANALLLTWAMLPDVIQAFYRKYGCRHEAIFYSTFTFFNKCIISLSLAGLNLVLDLASYDRFACTQPVTVVTALRCLMVAPLPLLILAILFAWQLPSDEPGAASVLVVDTEVVDESRQQLTLCQLNSGEATVAMTTDVKV